MLNTNRAYIRFEIFGDVLYVAMSETYEKHQRQGIMTAMKRSLYNCAREAGFKQIIVMPEHDASKKIANKFGFRIHNNTRMILNIK